MLAEQLAALRELGILGDNDFLEELLESSGGDVIRAANRYFDSQEALRAQRPREPRPAGERRSWEEPGAAGAAQEGKRERRRKGSGEEQQKAPAHQRHLQSKQGSAQQSMATGVHYTAKPGESYDVDVLRMRQTHVESGSERKIRRERKGVWRFDKKGSNWGVYPNYVSVELERIYVAVMKKGLIPAPETAPAKAGEDSALLSDPAAFSSGSLEDVRRLLDSEGDLGDEALAGARGRLLAAAEAGGLEEAAQAAELLERLAESPGFGCSAADARRAGLAVGSMRLLRAVLRASPGLSLVGEELFDRKHSKVNLQDCCRKNCVRALLARGMSLGAFAPQGKLLRKVEADAELAFALRCLDALLRAQPRLPETTRGRVLEMLGFREQAQGQVYSGWPG